MKSDYKVILKNGVSFNIGIDFGEMLGTFREMIEDDDWMFVIPDDKGTVRFNEIAAIVKVRYAVDMEVTDANY